MSEPLEKVCFRLRVRPSQLEAYRAAHASVWPEMVAALGAAGWQNYTVFVDDDGLMIGYFETRSFDDSMAAMEKSEVNRRWQSAMAEFFEPGHESLRRLDAVFHLPGGAPPEGRPTANS